MSEQTTPAPLFTVVDGNPTDEELAALTLVLAAAAAEGGPDGPVTRDHWGAPQDRLRPLWGPPASYYSRG